MVSLHSNLIPVFANLISAPASGLSDLQTYDADPGRRALQIRTMARTFQEAIAAPERCPFPVIVATHGFTLGLAIDIISACDVRYAASDSVLSIKVRHSSIFSS